MIFWMAGYLASSIEIILGAHFNMAIVVVVIVVSCHMMLNLLCPEGEQYTLTITFWYILSSNS